MKTNAISNLLKFLLIILGLGGIFGGTVLIISPAGKLFGMPLSMLENSPFDSFLIPGIILLLVFGLAPIGLTIALIKRPKSSFAGRFNFYRDMYWAWTYCIYTAFALIIWLQTEMVILRAVHWSHSVYMGLAIVILFVALLPGIRDQFKNES